MIGRKYPGFVLFCVAVGVVSWVVPTAVASDDGNAAANQVSQTSYRHFLDDELYTHVGDNRGFGPEHNLAQQNIVALMESYGLAVTLEPVYYSGQTYYNVVGTKTGYLFPNQEWIVGAHYDSVNNPGADDNASGVALVLEAARILGGYPSEYTIRFIAFDREEQGLYGSDEYATTHAADDILGMISGDMVAYNKGTNRVDIESRSTSRPIKNALAQAVTEYGLGLSSNINDFAADYSDHAPFEWQGFQACLIIEDWGNPYYHTPQDHIGMSGYIDYAFATRVTRSVVGFLVDNARVHMLLCGNGVVDPGELCDTAIAVGQPGACPTSCDDPDPCVTGTVAQPGTCLASCAFSEITEPVNGDGCCPPGAHSMIDDDCPPVCGNAICETGENVSCPADCTCIDDGDCNDYDVCTQGFCNGGACTYQSAPWPYGDTDHNGYINLLDLFCVLDGFQGDFANCSFLDDDIHPCTGNGIISLGDLFAVLDAYAGEYACCVAAPPVPTLVQRPADTGANERVWMSLVPAATTISPGQEVAVDVFVHGVQPGSYEMQVGARGGRGGYLELTSATIDDQRADYALGRDSIRTVDVERRRIAATSTGGQPVAERARGMYLGTYIFRASDDARGPFLLTIGSEEGAIYNAQGQAIELRTTPKAMITVR